MSLIHLGSRVLSELGRGVQCKWDEIRLEQLRAGMSPVLAHERIAHDASQNDNFLPAMVGPTVIRNGKPYELKSSFQGKPFLLDVLSPLPV